MFWNSLPVRCRVRSGGVGPIGSDSRAAFNAQPSVSRVKTSDVADRVMGRYVFRMARLPLAADVARLAWGRRAVLLGDNPATIDSLREGLGGLGVEVVVLSARQEPGRVAAEIERIWRDGPVAHLFILTSRDASPAAYTDEAQWNARVAAGLVVPFAACQKWFELVTAPGIDIRPSLIAVTAMGGGFGFQTPVDTVESGGIAGLLKAVGSESMGAIRVKVIDLPRHCTPADLARDVLTEAAADTAELEIGYDASRVRHVVRGKREAAAVHTPRSVRRGSTWIVTGGARGVTAYVAREMGRRFGLKLHLVGSSPIPEIDPNWRDLSSGGLSQLKTEVARNARARGDSPVDAWKRIERAIEIDASLRQCREAGVDAVYHCCDVSDRRRLGALIADIRRQDGPIEGVIHGAGVENACRFARKQLDSVERTIAAKVGGAAAIMSLLDDQPPRFFVGFGSTSGRFGGVGQADYSLANDMLCKLVRQYADKHPRVRAVCLDWTAWNEIGMAARPESRFALQAMKVRFMPPGEGVDHLIDELQFQGADTEVAIVENSGIVADHVSMSAAEEQTPAIGAPLPSATGTNGLDPSASHGNGKHPESMLEFGRKHSREITAYVCEFADRVAPPSGPQDVAKLPRAMRRVFESRSETELRDIATGAGIAAFSLFAHNPWMQERNSGGLPPRPEPARGRAPEPRRETQAVAPPRARDLSREIANLPLIDNAELSVTDNQLAAHVALRPDADVFLREHHLHKLPFLPAMASTEILSEAASLMAPGKVLVGLSNLDFVKGHTFMNNAPVTFKAIVRNIDGVLHCELRRPPVSGSSSEGEELLVSGIAEFADQVPAAPEVIVGRPVFSWTQFSYPESGVETLYTTARRFGR